MNDIEKTNKIKILRELQKNGRASLSELAKKTGLTRQTVGKMITNMEKRKQIWGYTAIFDPTSIGLKQFILLAKLDFSFNTEELMKKVSNIKLLMEYEEKYGVKTSMFLHGTSDLFVLIWVKDIVEAKKVSNICKKELYPHVKELDLLDVLVTFRNNGVVNPNMIKEWKNLLF